MLLVDSEDNLADSFTNNMQTFPVKNLLDSSKHTLRIRQFTRRAPFEQEENVECQQAHEE
jgi:hypothetical protein